MEYQEFTFEIEALTGINLRLYKEKQMKRRIEALIARLGLLGYKAYVGLLRQNEDALKYFLDYITINVTEFFRTPNHWRQLEQEVLPQMKSPKVWSCACATGQEAYSLAMSLAEQTSLENIHVLATDIDKGALAKAVVGEYREKELTNVPQSYLEKYFEPTKAGFRVRAEIRKCVEFQEINLLVDEYPKDLDLIVCRNILIYFTDEAKHKLLAGFHESLRPGGILFTGHTEQVLNYKQYGYGKIHNCLYYRE